MLAKHGDCTSYISGRSERRLLWRLCLWWLTRERFVAVKTLCVLNMPCILLNTMDHIGKAQQGNSPPHTHTRKRWETWSGLLNVHTLCISSSTQLRVAYQINIYSGVVPCSVDLFQGAGRILCWSVGVYGTYLCFSLCPNSIDLIRCACRLSLTTVPIEA